LHSNVLFTAISLRFKNVQTKLEQNYLKDALLSNNKHIGTNIISFQFHVLITCKARLTYQNSPKTRRPEVIHQTIRLVL